MLGLLTAMIRDAGMRFACYIQPGKGFPFIVRNAADVPWA